MDPLAAELSWIQARTAMQRARNIRRALVVPLRLGALADFGGAAAVMVVGRDHLLLWFLPAYVAVLAASATWYRRYAQRHGVWLPIAPWVAIIGPMVVAGATMSRLGVSLDMPRLNVAGPHLANAAAIAVTGAWLGSRRLAVTALAMVGVTIGVIAVVHGDAAVALQLAAYGCLLSFASKGTQ